MVNLYFGELVVSILLSSLNQHGLLDLILILVPVLSRILKIQTRRIVGLLFLFVLINELEVPDYLLTYNRVDLGTAKRLNFRDLK